MESLLGYQIRPCDLGEGWTSKVRENYVQHRMQALSARSAAAIM